MPEITPAPRAGTWLKINVSTPAWTPQPRAGTWVKLVPAPPPPIGSHRMVMTAGMAPR